VVRETVPCFSTAISRRCNPRAEMVWSTTVRLLRRGAAPISTSLAGPLARRRWLDAVGRKG
jgi:hypothetical protein